MNNHIQNIEISNFKSIKDLKIDGCKKINIFAGKPNAGKSNILEALASFQYNIDNANRVYNNLKNIPKRPLNDFVRYNEITELYYEGNILVETRIKINDLFLTLKFDHKSPENYFSDDQKFAFGKEDKFGNEILKDEFLKSIPIKLYKFKENFAEKTFSKSENLNYPFGENLGFILSTDGEIRPFINKFFQENGLKILIERNTNEIKVFKEYEDGTVFTLPYSMIADTLQRLIFFKTAIMSNANSVLLFEEPEAHCFEPYILEFTNEVKYNRNNNQFFIVTHSDFIIQEFLRDEESKNNTQIYLVNNVEGKTEVKKLETKKNDDVYEYGMNVFFNFDNLWQNS